MFTEKDIQKFAGLSKFHIPKGRQSEAVAFFNSFERETAELRGCNYDGVDVKTDMTQMNALREDIVVPSLKREELLSNSPVTEACCFIVPKIME